MYTALLYIIGNGQELAFSGDSSSCVCGVRCAVRGVYRTRTL